MTTFLTFAGTLLILVGLHEAGHFFAARAFGVYVKEFALGFGPKLLAYQGKETMYTLRIIPFGGYVRMVGEDRRETDEEIPADRVLYNKPAYARALISLAGPIANLVLAFAVILVVTWSVQLPVLQVSQAIPGSPASEALLPGDRVLSMDGRSIYTSAQITNVIQRSDGEPVQLMIERLGQPLTVSIVPDYVAEEDRYVLGAYFSGAAFTTELLSLDTDAPMAASELRAGDRIVAVEGEPVDMAIGLLLAFDTALPTDAVSLTIERDGGTQDLILPTAGLTADDMILGAEFADLGRESRHPAFADGIGLATGQFTGYIVMMADVIRGIVTGNVAAGEALSGPVGVARMLGQGLEMGASVFFQLLAFLSLNFGLINLIPFPALDGSRVAFALYETIRRKPIAPEREGLIHAIGFLILIGLMILITYQDILRLFR